MFLKTCVSLFVIFVFCQHSAASFGYWNKLSDGFCIKQNARLLSLLNLLCNTTQTTSIQLRDACYGCFFRAGNTLDGPTQLSLLNSCAQLYLANSIYGICALGLQGIINGNRVPPINAGSQQCYTGYCDFVRCIRRLNAQQLIASCYALSLGTRPLMLDIDRVYFYTNITSCILARTRCSQYNPISGELQNPNPLFIGPPVATAVGVAPATTVSLYFNALQISDSSELRILTFPSATTSIGDLFCSRLPTLQQAGFGGFNC